MEGGNCGTDADCCAFGPRPLRSRAGGGDPVPVLLKNGDASLDNAVNLVDMNLVLYRFNSEWSGPQDLVGDGWVGLSDLNIVLVNFALVGDDLP